MWEGPGGCCDGTIDVNGVSGLKISEVSAGGRVLQCDRLAAIAADALAANKMTVGLARGKPASILPGLVQRQLHDRLLIRFGVFTLSSTGSRGAKKTDSRACLEIAFEYQPDLMQNAAIDIIGGTSAIRRSHA